MKQKRPDTILEKIFTAIAYLGIGAALAYTPIIKSNNPPPKKQHGMKVIPRDTDGDGMPDTYLFFKPGEFSFLGDIDGDGYKDIVVYTEKEITIEYGIKKGFKDKIVIPRTSSDLDDKLNMIKKLPIEL